MSSDAGDKRPVALFTSWCESQKEQVGRKRYWNLVEKSGGRDVIRDLLAETMRSHYDRLDRIADDVARLGYDKAATILRAILPITARARSGELGESGNRTCGRGNRVKGPSSSVALQGRP